MQESITVSIPKEIKQALDREHKAKGISRSAVVSDALKKYFALREIAELRQKMIPKARA
jgi:metal-responsive CopG/Arc/MetJ family transcriptional regulator